MSYVDLIAYILIAFIVLGMIVASVSVRHDLRFKPKRVVIKENWFCFIPPFSLVIGISFVIYLVKIIVVKKKTR